MLKDPRRVNTYGVSARESLADEPNHHVAVKHQLLRALYWLEMSVANVHLNEINDKNWNYIPFSHLSFLKVLKKVMRRKDKNKIRFLEVGCGVGTKLWLAYWILNIKHVCGIEINPSFATIAKEMIDECTCFGNENRIYDGDAKEFTKYNKFDIIYTYTPMRSPAANKKLIHKIKSDMKVGATLLCASFAQHQITSWTKTEDNYANTESA